VLATAGALAFRPRYQAPIVVTAGTAGARRAPVALRRWLTTVAATPARGTRLTRIVPPGASRSRTAVLLRMPLGAAGAAAHVASCSTSRSSETKPRISPV